MRVLHVISSIDPENGGVTEFVLTLLRHAAPGDSVEVVTLDDPSVPFLKVLPASIHAIGPGRTAFAYTPAFPAWLRENLPRFDGVVLHGLWQYNNLAVFRAISKSKPYVVLPHGMLDPYFKYQSRFKHYRKWLYWVAAEYWILRGAARVVFTTQEEARLARESFWLHRWKEAVIPFGTMPPPPDPEAQVAAFFERTPQLRGRSFLLFLGRIHPKKGCDLLIEAVAEVAHRMPGVDLLMAGPDQMGWAAELQARSAELGVADRIHWTGMIDGDAKWGALRAAEAFVLPSHQENFGIAVAEALACGTPVLLSDKVNIAPEIAADRAGYVEPDTREGVNRLLERWLASTAAERAELAASALVCFERRYDLRGNIQAIHNLFRPAGPS
ncbi:Glycosyltransferase involved in cell wall bisynthesis [Granulicella rosea]|uniref:Glycosyltransferase involved in cell wall bisynthesis n=1 Tax=Granulicella rosea TaxID=474952 RepID=A0A239HEB7_9BACT|nr:glycosyltransferase [Granulicella rosea]SNS79501.1 Glycosyltransferase involved in cell wall bisynthesis [Granulicella rosea]